MKNHCRNEDIYYGNKGKTVSPKRSERNSYQFHQEKDFTLKIPPKFLLTHVPEFLLSVQKTDGISTYSFILKACKD